MTQYEKFQSILTALYKDDIKLLYNYIEDKNIFLAHDQSSKVIVKFIDENTINKDLLKELVTLEHPHISKYYRVGFKEGYVIVVREYVEGKTLYDLIEEKGALDLIYVKQLAKSIASTLSYLHEGERRLIFRDLHPKNIIINQMNQPILIDLVTMREYSEDKSKDTMIIGSLGFIAPEQLGYRQSSEKSDIYALGAVMYYALTRQVLNSETDAKSLKDINKHISKIIHKMVSFSPKDRYDSLRQVINQLDKDDQFFSIKSYVLGLCTGCIVMFFIAAFIFNTKDLSTPHVLEEKEQVSETQVDLPVDDFENTLVTVKAFNEEGYLNEIHPLMVKDTMDVEWAYVESVVGMNIVHVRNFSVYKYETEANYYIQIDFEMTQSNKYATMFLAEDYPGLKAHFQVDSKIGMNSIRFQFNKEDFIQYAMDIPQESRLLAINLFSGGDDLQALFIPIDEIL